MRSGDLSTGLAKALHYNGKSGNFVAMDEDRIERAVQRIEAALGRIGTAADSIEPAPASVSNLVNKHEELRESVANSLKDLDELIDRLEE